MVISAILRGSVFFTALAGFGIIGSAVVEAAPATESLNLEDFFLGHLSGSGAADDVEHGKRTLNVSGAGTRVPGGLKVAFDTVFSDGEKKHILWTFMQDGHGGYVGHRDDLVGSASITQTGNEIAMTYQAKIGASGGTKTLGFDEHFTLASPNTIVDRMTGTFLFLNVASGDITIHKSANR